MLNLYLLRHGSVESNEHKRYIGVTDEELSEIGHNQARYMSKKSNVEFKRIISSPLKRCRQTAAYFGDFEVDERLLELNFGIFEKKDYMQIQREFKEEYSAWCRDYKNYKIPQGESLMELFKRVEDFLDDIKKEEGNILIVTSGGVIRCMLSLVFESYDYFYKFEIENCNMSIITTYDGCYWYIKKLNGGV
ncbi:MULTISPECIES: histidine phosphatase family protein [Caloramator]|uniref:Alpha-ribazole phosphatase n=1 Tax=Caloramator proteoclasticus DSM 10124 TaxID=1121262 RepID=A0A1M4S8A2_9CLOT|nr:MULTISPECIES: histidine phosphatase family protein [Caloramator]SHE28395.1 alpha-ribazole phosphatase [Caloramator proteoclasticus DSM 10124]